MDGWMVERRMRWISRRGFVVMMGGMGVGAWARESTGMMQVVERTSWAMGTEVKMRVLHRRRETAERAIGAAFEELGRVDRIMSLYRQESQVSVLNREGVLEDPDSRLVEVLEAAREMSKRTEGAFDVTVQPLWEVYAAAKKEGRLPEEGALREAKAKVDWRKVEGSTRRVVLKGKGMAITLNGIAQGYAADRVMAALRGYGVEDALVNTGEVGAMGRKEDGSGWTVGVQHPRRADAFVAVAKLEDRFLATSGDYATAFSEDWSEHHVFDPSTGKSPREFSSVSVLAKTGMEADAFSTAVFVLGYERGMKMVKETDGVEALFVLKDGRVVATGGFPRV